MQTQTKPIDDIRIPSARTEEQPVAKNDYQRNETLICFLVSIFVTSATARIVDRMNEGFDWGGKGILPMLTGHAPFQAFQNRLFGPLLAHCLQKMTGMPNNDACQSICMLGLYVASFIIFLGVRKFANARAAVMTVAVTMFFYIVLQTPNQGHMEDTFDIAFLSALVCMAYLKVSWKAFIPLFLLQIVNKETGLAVACWVIVSSINFKSIRNIKIDWIPLIAGILMFFVGAVYIHWCRSSFFHGNASVHFCKYVIFDGQWWMFNFKMPNLAWMIPNMPGPLLLIGALLGIPFAMKKHLGQNLWQYFLLNMMILLPILLFGMIGEERVWMEAIPFAVIPFGAILNGGQTFNRRSRNG